MIVEPEPPEDSATLIEFGAWCSAVLALEPSVEVRSDPLSRFHEDWGVDSLGMVQLVVEIEAVSAAQPEGVFPAIVCLRDASIIGGCACPIGRRTARITLTISTRVRVAAIV